MLDISSGMRFCIFSNCFIFGLDGFQVCPLSQIRSFHIASVRMCTFCLGLICFVLAPFQVKCRVLMTVWYLAYLRRSFRPDSSFFWRVVTSWQKSGQLGRSISSSNIHENGVAVMSLAGMAALKECGHDGFSSKLIGVIVLGSEDR